MKKEFLACALGALLVAGCGDSDDPVELSDVPLSTNGFDAGDDGLPDDDAPADGTLAGRVIEERGDAPGSTGEVALAGVEVALVRFDDGRTVATDESDANGEFAFDGLARNEAYRLELSIDGYLDETVRSVRLPIEDRLSLEPVRLVSDDNAGAGGLSGTLLNAVTGEPVGGLTLTFRRGIQARTGGFADRVTTDAAGGYVVSGLDYGNYTCEIVGEGFRTIYTTVTVLGGIERDRQNAAASPRVDVGETRIVLTWGRSPDDLDSHFAGPGADGAPPFHVYFADKEASGVELDVDDVSSFGPETITTDLDGIGPYRYSVYNFGGGAATVLSRSGAAVRVEREEGVVAEFFVPRGEGDLWTVFDIVGGEIVPIDTIDDGGRTSDFFAPGVLETGSARLRAMPLAK